MNDRSLLKRVARLQENEANGCGKLRINEVTKPRTFQKRTRIRFKARSVWTLGKTLRKIRKSNLGHPGAFKQDAAMLGRILEAGEPCSPKPLGNPEFEFSNSGFNFKQTNQMESVNSSLDKFLQIKKWLRSRDFHSMGDRLLRDIEIQQQMVLVERIFS